MVKYNIETEGVKYHIFVRDSADKHHTNPPLTPRKKHCKGVTGACYALSGLIIGMTSNPGRYPGLECEALSGQRDPLKSSPYTRSLEVYTNFCAGCLAKATDIFLGHPRP